MFYNLLLPLICPWLFKIYNIFSFNMDHISHKICVQFQSNMGAEIGIVNDN